MANNHQAVFEFKTATAHDYVKADWTPGPDASIEVLWEFQGHSGVQKFPAQASFQTSVQFSGQGAIVGLRLIGGKNGTGASAAFGNYT